MATVITGEDLRLFFVNPSWGEHGTSPVEIGAIKVSVSFSADYANDSSFTKSRIKPQKRSGTISMSVPLTLANFEFVNAMRLQESAPTIWPSIYQSSVEYLGLICRKISYSLVEDALVVAEISFDFNNIQHAGAIYPGFQIQDRFGPTGNFVSLIFLVDLSSAENALNISTSTLTLTDMYAEENNSSRNISEYTIDSIGLDFNLEYQVAKKIGSLLPRKIILTSSEVDMSVTMPLLEEQSQINYLARYDGDNLGISNVTFKLDVLFRDIEETPVTSLISLNATLLGIESQINSFNVPQGSMTLKQKIK